MRKLTRIARILAPALAAPLLVPAAAAAADQPVESFEAAQQAAWNAHDAAAYTAAFDPNATIVTSLGWRWTGQADAARNLGDGFKFVYARAHLQIADVQVRALTPDLALVTLTWSIESARTLDTGLTAGEQHGFESQLLQRRGASWLILSQQDTLAAAASSPPAPAPSVEAAGPTPSAFPTTPPPVRRCIIARKSGDCVLYGKAKPAKTD